MISQYHGDMDLYDHTRHLTCNLCSKKWLSHLNSFDVQMLLVRDRCMCGVQVKPSTLHHLVAGK